MMGVEGDAAKVLDEVARERWLRAVGKQVLKLVNEEKNISSSVEVEIKAGQTTKKQLKL